MPSQSIQKLLEGLENDLPRSAQLQQKVPALAEAFDAGRMKTTLQEILLGSDNSQYSITECIPGKALYLLDHIINMQFKLKILDASNDETIATLVNARLFPDAAEIGRASCRESG